MAIGDGVSAIASLTIGFGGFAPTAFDGVEASKRLFDQAENAMVRQRELTRKKRELEWGQTSKPRNHVDETGTVWVYVVVNEQFARILSCEPALPRLVLPSSIEGFPVRDLAPDACSRLDDVVEIICPDSIEHIGLCAFRLCSNLKKIVFPREVPEFSGSWLQHCPNLEELVLPGQLHVISSAVFDNEGLKRLVIGKHVEAVDAGAFEKTHLEKLEVDAENPYLTSDGTALYTADGSVLIALCKPVDQYEIADGCVRIAKKACCNIASLRSVSFPETLRATDAFAFAHTGLDEVTLPAGFLDLGEKTFFHCRNLHHAALNEGIVRIGNSAFEESSLESLRIPASIEQIGSSIIANTNVVASGPDATISIDEDAPALFLDGSGGLYRREEDGIHLLQLIDANVVSFVAHPKTRVVDARAFAFHDAIEYAEFSDGLEVIGDFAFRICHNLRRVVLPDSLKSIGEEAFLDTKLEEVRIPKALESIGVDAFVTLGAHYFGDPPEIRKAEVAEGNERYFVDDGMLFERVKRGLRIVLYTGEVRDVTIPEGVTDIASFAFSNARTVKTLSLPKSLKIIESNGLSLWSLIESIHVELAEPLEGRTTFDFRFPATDRSIHSISLALGGSSWVNVPDIMAQYDNCVANAHDYRGNGRDSISVYEQVTRILDRLRDPILLTRVNRNMFDRLVREHLEEMCVDIARHDDRRAMDALMEFGYLNEENLEQVIAAVGRLQDAAMTAYLLEVKRRRFNKRAFDYDL